jgi:2-dehydro-3-deoxygalactonokinase
MNKPLAEDIVCYIGIDLGTTTTRVWLVEGGISVHRLSASVGVRDTARNGNNDQLRSTLRELIVQQQDKATELGLIPRFVIGAGMLTSALGLKEIPHVHGPVNIEKLKSNVSVRTFPDVTSLPVMLVPGVKTGAPGVNAWEIEDMDVIRGEETLCVGMIASGVLRPDSVLINLGSHWKVIFLNSECWIDQCLTNLSGEMMFAVQTQTILASAVLTGRPPRLDESWVRHGISEERDSGLARALFCVRLLELDARTSPTQRLSYLVGSFISHSLSALSKKLTLRKHVVISGAAGIAGAWKLALDDYGIEAEDYSDRTEETFIRGLTMLSGSNALIV